MEEKKRGKKSLIARLADKLKANKKLEYAVYAIIALLIVALYLSSLLGDSKSEQAAQQQSGQSTSAMGERDVEKRLEEVLSNIRGAGRVEVMITYETGPELVTAMSTDTNTNRSESVGDGKQSNTEQETQSQKPATVSGSGGSSPIIITEKQPSVRGVIVIAEGASDLMVRTNLQRAVQTVLDVPVGSIEVFERQRTEE